MRGHQCVILHLPAKFRSNRTVVSWVMTSYRLFKMAAMQSERYFRFQVQWQFLFKKLETYLSTKFQRDNSIRGWDITASNSISAFYFDLRIVIGIPFCICLPNFVVIGWLSADLWRTFHFFKMAIGTAAILDFMWIMLDHPRNAVVGLNLILKFGLDPIYSYGDIVIFIFCCFGLKLPYFPQIWSPIILTPKRTILARKHVWAIKCENLPSGSTWAQDREKR